MIGEADGLGKYGSGDADVRRILAAERQRQTDLEAAGYTVVRWSSQEPARLWLRRLRAALAPT